MPPFNIESSPSDISCFEDASFSNSKTEKHVEIDSAHTYTHCNTIKPRRSSMKKNTMLSSSSLQSATEDLNKTSISKNNTRGISFSTLEIREYNITIGDNPGGSTSSGTPISLSWEFDTANIQFHDVKTYEEQRGSRRSMHYLYLPAYIRHHKLSKSGCTNQEIIEAAKEAKKIRDQRYKTNIVNSIAPIVIQQVFRCTRKKLKRLSRSTSLNVV